MKDLLELLGVVMVAVSSFFAFGFFAYIRGKGDGTKEIKNKQNEEILKNARESKKIGNSISSADDRELAERLQKFARDHE